MLLLFWKALGLNTGSPLDVKWYHTSGWPPRCLVGCDSGLSITNPYMSQTHSECSYAYINKRCVSSDVYDGKIILGTESDGLYYLDLMQTMYSTNTNIPPDLASEVETFSDFSGLLSNNILKIEANNDYLGILTADGFSYGKKGTSDFINFSTTSGKDCFVCKSDYVYVAEGNRVFAKNAPTDFVTWDRDYTLDQEINDIWVVEKDGINTLFVATENGLSIFEKDEIFQYGSKNYSQIKAEVGTTINQGHVFAVASNTVDIINMRTKSLESSTTYSGVATLGIENVRLYSK
jgi:hypothetical protein